MNFDSETYKGHNTVERSFSLFKQWRPIAIRYDKLPLTYRAGVLLCAVGWLHGSPWFVVKRIPCLES